MPRRVEQTIQQAVVQHLRLRGAPGLVFFHVPLNKHGTGRKFHIQGAIAQSMGARAGVSDLILVRNGTPYALELKAEGGRTSESQDDFLADWKAAGGYGMVAEGLDKALKILECWGLLVGSAQTSADYNAEDDFAKSIDWAYEHIRERKAKGGKGWRE